MAQALLEVTFLMYFLLYYNSGRSVRMIYLRKNSGGSYPVYVACHFVILHIDVHVFPCVCFLESKYRVVLSINKNALLLQIKIFPSSEEMR